MAQYTVTIKTLIDMGFAFGLNDYPIITEQYRAQLNKKIIDRYLFYEIGYETPEMFRHFLNTKMREIMPYYNKMIQSELLTFNPLLTFQTTRNEVKDATKNINNNGSTSMSGVQGQEGKQDTSTYNSATNRNSGTVETVGTGKDVNVTSDTPMNMLIEGEIDINGYATGVAKDDSSTTSKLTNDLMVTNIDENSEGVTTENTVTSSNNATINNTNNEVAKDIITVAENGFDVSGSELLQRYRDTFLNVDVMIIESLKPLFMSIL